MKVKQWTSLAFKPLDNPCMENSADMYDSFSEEYDTGGSHRGVWARIRPPSTESEVVTVRLQK